MNKTLMAMLAAGLAALGFNAAQAHGDAKPKHGGIVQTANDISFELVAQADGAVIYIEDHEKAVSVAGAGGKLTVLSGADKAEAELKPAGDKLEAKGIRLSPGSKVVASVITADKKTISVRFSVK